MQNLIQPIPTAAPVPGTSYLPMSSYTDPLASNYRVQPLNYSPSNFSPVGGYQPGQLNAFGNPIIQGSPVQPQKTDPSTGQFLPVPGPTPQPPSGSNGPGYQGNVKDQTVSQGGQTWHWNGTSWELINSGNGVSWNDQINSAYQGQIDYLNGLAGQVQGNQDTALELSSKQYGNLQNALPGEQQSFNQTSDQAQNSLDTTANSAYAQAVRTYNNDKQRANVLYGMGSSTGQGFQDLGYQQLGRNQGQIGAGKVASQGQIEAQKLAFTNYITKKKGDLDLAKQAAEDKIKSDFQGQLNQINQNRVLTEQQKTNAKMSVLQQTIADSKAIAQHAQTLNDQIQLFAAQQYATVTGQAYTPQAYQNFIQNPENRLGGGPTNGVSNVNAFNYSGALPGYRNNGDGTMTNL